MLKVRWTWAVGAGMLLGAATLLPPALAAEPAAPTVQEPQQNAQQMVQRMLQRFPPGSVLTREQADDALMATRAVHARLQLEFEAAARQCDDAFFYNRCMDAARRIQRAGEQRVRALTLEAHDLQRRLDGIVHANSRTDAARQQAADDLLRPERERQAVEATRMREVNAAAREEDAKRDLAKAAQDSAENVARARAHEADVARKDALRPREETVSLRDFKDKQQQAAAYAKTRADDRAANAKRRSDRQKEREAEAAADQRAAAAAPVPGAPAAHP